MGSPSVSVVVPVFNSQDTLPALIERLSRVLNGSASEFEIILVNDASLDQSWEQVVELARSDARILGIDLVRNFGQHNALLCGIRAATKDVIVTIDDDLQNPPEEIPKLLNKLRQGYDVVYGSPRKLSHGLLRNAASTITKIGLQTSMGVETARHVSAFRAFRRDISAAFAAFSHSFVCLDVLLTWGARRFSYVEVDHHARTSGVSNYTLGKLINHATNMITGFSIAPLRLASACGFAITLFGMAVLAYVVTRFLAEGGAPPGFPFLASIVTIFSGTQLFAIGVIGEYLARVHIRLMDRPVYAVRRTVGEERLAAPMPRAA